MSSVHVVDDDIRLLQAIQIRLESLGYTVMTAQDAYHALAMTVRSHPDLIVLDVNLPAGNGFGIEQRLHEIDELSNTPVIYMTGESPDSIDAPVRLSHARAVHYKPFRFDDLAASIIEVLGR